MSLLHRLKLRFERSWPIASLRAYLFAVMLVATLPLAALMGLQIVLDLRSEQARRDGELARSAASLAQAVQRQLTSSIEGLGVLAQSELFQHGRIAALGRLLHGRPRRDWDSVFLLDRDGSVVLDTASPRPAPAELRALQQRVLRDQRPAVSGLADNQRAGNRSIAVALPVLQNGQLRYVLGARMGEAVWQRLAATASAPAGAHAAVFDAQDRLIGTSLAAVAPPGAVLPRDAAAALQGQAAGVQRSSDVDGRMVYAGWREVPLAGWRVWVALPAAPIDAARGQALAAAFATGGGTLLLGLLLAALVAHRVARPLQRLAQDAHSGHAGHVPVREIALLRDALHRARRARDEFLMMMDHELRHPLGAISAACGVLEAAEPASRPAAEARAIIGRQCRNLAQVMNDLMDVEHTVAGRIALSRQPVNLAAVVRRVDESLAITGEAREHPLRLELEDAWVDGDAARIEQVVTGLLTNAISSTPAGRPIHVRVAREQDASFLEVRAGDTGVPAAPRPRVVDLVDQGLQPLERRSGGPGIGLGLVQRLVELHGGSLTVDRCVAGSRFRVRLPARAAAR